MIEPLVSIVLPVYNRKKYLVKAIDSVLQQTYQNWELIIANDNSSENTKAFLEGYAAISKVKIYYNTQNLEQTFLYCH
ncbi:glycosyltransferase family 2 protein [Nostoc sp.]|uniref:glycosyltransferase family 2 protein n=1 Tax=Nostoc sp. TaxID=1180 RepID=UPI002FFCC06A